MGDVTPAGHPKMKLLSLPRQPHNEEAISCSPLYPNFVSTQARDASPLHLEALRK
jgi:hypothetical protein